MKIPDNKDKTLDNFEVAYSPEEDPDKPSTVVYVLIGLQLLRFSTPPSQIIRFLRILFTT